MSLKTRDRIISHLGSKYIGTIHEIISGGGCMIQWDYNIKLGIGPTYFRLDWIKLLKTPTKGHKLTKIFK